jgi:hypothetical protein
MIAVIAITNTERTARAMVLAATKLESMLIPLKFLSATVLEDIWFAQQLGRLLASLSHHTRGKCFATKIWLPPPIWAKTIRQSGD